MLKFKVLQWTFYTGLGLIFFHFLGIGITTAEKVALRRFTGLRDGVVSGMAHDLGYIKPVTYNTGDIYQFIDAECRTAGLNPSLIYSMLHIESAGDHFATSPVGAIGLLQVMPTWAKACGLKHFSELYDDEKNVRCGIKIISEELKSTKGNVIRALRRYNGGPKCEFNSCKETDQYVPAVLNRWASNLTCKVS